MLPLSLSLFLQAGTVFGLFCLCLFFSDLEQPSSVSVSFTSTWTVFLLCFCLLSFNLEQSSSSSVSFPSTWNSLRPSLFLSPFLQPGTVFLFLCLFSFNLDSLPSLFLSPFLQPGTVFLLRLCLLSFNLEQSSSVSVSCPSTRNCPPMPVFDPCTPNIPFHPKQFLPPGSLPLPLSLALAPKTYRTTTQQAKWMHFITP